MGKDYNQPRSNQGANRHGTQQQGYGGQQQVAPVRLPDLNDKELVGKKAEELAFQIAQKLPRERENLSTSQLRNFFGEFKQIERELIATEDQKEKWESVYPRIKLIKAKAVYNAERKSGKIPEQYKDFLSQCVDKIEADYETGYKSFKKVCQLFEAVVGYASAYTRN